MNPELLRNVWLELTPVRRWATPPVLLAIMAMIELAGGKGEAGWEPHWGAQASFGMTLLSIFAVWACWKSSNSVTAEVLANTWDLQRLGQHRPWELLWGKLLGSSLFENLVAYFGLALFLAGSAGSGKLLGADLLSLGLTLLLTLWLMQSISVMMSLVGARHLVGTRRPARPAMSLAAGLLVLLCLGYALTGLQESDESRQVVIHWWLTVPLRAFIPLSLAMFLGWSLILAHRLMRAELQEAVGPLPWLGFQLFLMLYLFPLVPAEAAAGLGGPAALFCAVAIGVLSTFVYPFLLMERKDLVVWRSLRASLRQGDAFGVWTRVPLWVLNLGMLALAWLGLVLGQLVQPGPYGALVAVAVASLALFMLRDAAWIVAVHLSPSLSRSPDLTVLFFMALAYGLVPGLVLLTVPGAVFLLVPKLPTVEHGVAALPAVMWTDPLWALPGLLVALVWLLPRLGDAFKD